MPPPPDGGRLQQFIVDERTDEALYRVLFRQGSGNKTFSCIANDEHRHAHRLSAAYFLLTGVHFLPTVPPPKLHPCNHFGTLRQQYWSEKKGAQTYRNAAANSPEERLREVYAELAAEEDAHAQLIWGILERM